MVARVTVTSKEIREARAYLQKRNLTTSDVSPKDFATLAKRFGKPFSEVLELIAHLQMRGQGEHPAGKTVQAVKEIERAKA